MQDAPIIVYAGILTKCRMPSPIIAYVFVLKSELKIGVLEGVNKSFRPIGVGRNTNNL